MFFTPFARLKAARKAFNRLIKALDKTALKAEDKASKKMIKAGKLRDQASDLNMCAADARRMKQNIAKLIGMEE